MSTPSHNRKLGNKLPSSSVECKADTTTVGDGRTSARKHAAPDSRLPLPDEKSSWPDEEPAPRYWDLKASAGMHQSNLTRRHLKPDGVAASSSRFGLDSPPVMYGADDEAATGNIQAMKRSLLELMDSFRADKFNAFGSSEQLPRLADVCAMQRDLGKLHLRLDAGAKGCSDRDKKRMEAANNVTLMRNLDELSGAIRGLKAPADSNEEDDAAS